jgi:hypothetical protein
MPCTDKLKFHHLAVATAHIENSIHTFCALGYIQHTDIITDTTQNVQLCFLRADGFPFLELVAPLSPKSPVSNILNKMGGASPYHFCFSCENLQETADQLKNEGYIALTEPVEAIAFDMQKICFLYHPSAGLIELLETQ